MKRHTRFAVVLFAVAAIPATVIAQAPTGDLNSAVLDVNGEKIYAGEITITMRNLAAQMGGQATAENQEALAQTAMQQVVEQKLLAQEARRAGMKANEERLAQMIQMVEQQAGGREALEKDLASFGMSFDEMTSYFRELELTRSLIENRISPTIQVSDEEVAAFYEEYPELFDAEEQVRAREIFIRLPLDADADTVNQTRARAEDIRRRAVAGEDFAALARELSEAPTAPNGGEIGFFTRGQAPPQFANAAFSTEAGGITPVVRTNSGYHVIKVEEKRPARRLPLDEVFEHVRNLLQQRNTGEAVSELVKALGAKATIVNLVTGQPVASGPPAQ
jgi:peptidyl-prolyl cis-trans isomerase C